MRKLISTVVLSLISVSSFEAIAGGGGCEYMGPDVVDVAEGSSCIGPGFSMKVIERKNDYNYVVEIQLDDRSWTEEVQIDYGGANCFHEDVWIVPTSVSKSKTKSNWSIFGNGTSGKNYSLMFSDSEELEFDQSIQCTGITKPVR
jgi:hypothetical protein